VFLVSTDLPWFKYLFKKLPPGQGVIRMPQRAVGQLFKKILKPLAVIEVRTTPLSTRTTLHIYNIEILFTIFEEQ